MTMRVSIFKLKAKISEAELERDRSKSRLASCKSDSPLCRQYSEQVVAWGRNVECLIRQQGRLEAMRMRIEHMMQNQATTRVVCELAAGIAREVEPHAKPEQLMAVVDAFEKQLEGVETSFAIVDESMGKTQEKIAPAFEVDALMAQQQEMHDINEAVAIDMLPEAIPVVNVIEKNVPSQAKSPTNGGGGGGGGVVEQKSEDSVMQDRLRML